MQTYFVLDRTTNYLKIGKTKDFKKRLSALECGVGRKLTTLKVIEGDHEKKLHELFRPYRQKGEWFVYSTMLANRLRKDYQITIPRIESNSKGCVNYEDFRIIIEDMIGYPIEENLSNRGDHVGDHLSDDNVLSKMFVDLEGKLISENMEIIKKEPDGDYLPGVDLLDKAVIMTEPDIIRIRRSYKIFIKWWSRIYGWNVTCREDIDILHIVFWEPPSPLCEAFLHDLEEIESTRPKGFCFIPFLVNEKSRKVSLLISSSAGD